MEHMPLNWFIENPAADEDANVEIVAPDKPDSPWNICSVHAHIPGGTLNAARLIAAAPDLLEALKDAVTLARKAIVMGGTDEEFANIRLEKAIAAIAKAEGRT